MIFLIKKALFLSEKVETNALVRIAIFNFKWCHTQNKLTYTMIPNSKFAQVRLKRVSIYRKERLEGTTKTFKKKVLSWTEKRSKKDESLQ